MSEKKKKLRDPSTWSLEDYENAMDVVADNKDSDDPRFGQLSTAVTWFEKNMLPKDKPGQEYEEIDENGDSIGDVAETADDASIDDEESNLDEDTGPKEEIGDENSEVEQLRARVAELESQRSTPEPGLVERATSAISEAVQPYTSPWQSMQKA